MFFQLHLQTSILKKKTKKEKKKKIVVMRGFEIYWSWIYMMQGVFAICRLHAFQIIWIMYKCWWELGWVKPGLFYGGRVKNQMLFMQVLCCNLQKKRKGKLFFFWKEKKNLICIYYEFILGVFKSSKLLGFFLIMGYRVRVTQIYACQSSATLTLVSWHPSVFFPLLFFWVHNTKRLTQNSNLNSQNLSKQTMNQ